MIGERPCAYLAQGGCITQVAFRISINYERPCASNIVYGVKVIPRRNVYLYIYIYIYAYIGVMDYPYEICYPWVH